MIMKKINFNDPATFEKLERMAYENTLDIVISRAVDLTSQLVRLSYILLVSDFCLVIFPCFVCVLAIITKICVLAFLAKPFRKLTAAVDTAEL